MGLIVDPGMKESWTSDPKWLGKHLSVSPVRALITSVLLAGHWSASAEKNPTKLDIEGLFERLRKS